MEIKILEQKENPLLKRKDIVVSIDFKGGATPPKTVLQGKLAEMLNSNPELVEIRKILSSVGKADGIALVKLWETKPPEKKKKGKTAEAKPAEIKSQ